MKAWMCSFYSDDENITLLIHAETRAKAKVHFIDAWPGIEYIDYRDIRAVRVSVLDDKPFTLENVKDAEVYRDDFEECWYNDCHCEICRNGN